VLVQDADDDGAVRFFDLPAMLQESVDCIGEILRRSGRKTPTTTASNK